MKGAYHDPIDHSRTTQPHAGENFIDTLCLPGLTLIGLGVVAIAGLVAATAYKHDEYVLTLGLLAGALVTAGWLLLTFEHHRVKRIEERWMAEHPGASPRLHAG
ncbi:protein UsfY [Mycobacterium parmense]|uniref:UsfY protein n=1 Tax=Mycobacterium parmense TaxID=185642 RepID=A0A7I7YRB1_9MYCO|nr:protein UsfY [Mycobacterium parmense]MCV7349598.1 LapA family protein [Mycobacterium parmense]ORW58886.1 UsfY protein [Mycobacterium parmense]BBZ43767.1 UsfY protein [Mycobacterium parmense]